MPHLTYYYYIVCIVVVICLNKHLCIIYICIYICVCMCYTNMYVSMYALNCANRFSINLLGFCIFVFCCWHVIFFVVILIAVATNNNNKKCCIGFVGQLHIYNNKTTTKKKSVQPWCYQHFMTWRWFCCTALLWAIVCTEEQLICAVSVTSS